MTNQEILNDISYTQSSQYNANQQSLNKLEDVKNNVIEVYKEVKDDTLVDIIPNNNNSIINNNELNNKLILAELLKIKNNNKIIFLLLILALTLLLIAIFK